MKQAAETNNSSLKAILSNRDMNPKDPSSHPDSDAESGDAEVVAMIHPLPDDVGPSELFMQQMRLRIMKLQAAKAAASKQAA